MRELDVREGIVSDEYCALTYQISSNPREFDTFKEKREEQDYEDTTYHIGEWTIMTYGSNDNLPDIIQKTVQENPTAPGMLEKKMMMVYGQGPFLYRQEIKDNQPIKTLVEDTEVQKWLDSWFYEDYLMKCCVDYDYMKGHFTKFHRNRAPRVGGDGKIVKLEHIEMKEARLARRTDAVDKVPTHIIVTDFSLQELHSITNMKVYPIFDLLDPFKHPTSAYYSNQYSFGNKHYTTPPIFGSLEWLKRSTAIPIIFKALSKNAINIKYHVESPQEFWDQEEERIKNNCKAKGETYEEQMLVDYRTAFMRDLLKVLASEENTGKVWHTRKILEVQGNNILEHGWKITVIDQKIKDFVSSQILISQRADRALSTNFGVHGSIGNVGDSGKSDSGSEQLYAYQNFVNSGTEIPEYIICKAINYALKVNFPNKKLKIGFHQTTTQKESDISPSNRLKEQ
ncbi:hypothetical protein ACI6PS_02575 [Flavobacterium sp. PLA-1-15]|uniref:hypothetical protein n=1 Tax=Flavobacterium sp. PLA-1-15 TaxID=3380533 RepID=UPI003B7C389B